MNITGASDLHVLSNRIAPGGSFGWHSHPGPSFVIVKSGTATVYFGADPTCRPHRFRAGQGFVDKGLQVHVVRNEGKVDLVTVVVSFTPRGAMRRIDEAKPRQLPVLGATAEGGPTAHPPAGSNTGRPPRKVQTF